MNTLEDMSRGLIVDLFAGGGGASLGLEMALGRAVDVAVNHNPEAVAIHALNHPSTMHFTQNICNVHPLDATGGRPVDVLWASPDCKHFSKAKGTAPKARNIRELAWAVVHWVRYTKPKLVIVENVEEFKGWGPIDGQGMPIKERAGETFNRWLKALERLGYRVDFRLLRACDYGAPTIRRRLFIVARRNGRAVVWPERTHGPGRPQPYRTAAECIDWNIPVPSIFDRPKPLAENTLRRITEGLRRFVIEAERPFIVNPDKAVCLTPFIQHVQHGGPGRTGVMPADEPLRTVTAYPKGGGMALVSAFVAKANHTADYYRCFRGQGISDPLQTVTQSPGFSLVAAHLAHFYGTPQDGDIGKPLKTVTYNNHAGLVAAFLTKYYGKSNCQSLEGPLDTVTATDRFGLVLVHVGGEPYVIADIGLRMLTPRELARAQGFPDGYRFDPSVNGKLLGKKAQVAAIGNSVPPPFSHALVKANMDALEYAGQPRRWDRRSSEQLPFPTETQAGSDLIEVGGGRQ